MSDSTSDSDFEDENLARMRESVDADLLTDGLFNGKNCTNDIDVIVKQPSLRLEKSEEDNWIKTTPAFRTYVAKLLIKQLDPILDKDLVNLSIANNTTNKTKTVKSRVKLFKASKKCIKTEENLEKPVKRRFVPELNYEELENTCKLVAIDGLDILGKAETKAWSTRTKAPVTKYTKLKDGNYVEQCTFK